jgi:hypothetical protein
MGGIGRQNPLGTEIGGGEGTVEQVYLALRANLGEGGAGPPGSLEDEARWAKAEMIAVAMAHMERALLQYFPDHATDFIPAYEQDLNVPRRETDVERREAITAAYVGGTGAVWPWLLTQLRKAVPTIDFVQQDPDQSFEFQPGRYLRPREDAAAIAAYGVNATSAFPAYSSHFVLTVLWPGGIPDPALRDQVARTLNDSLQSWCDWRIINSRPLYCDGFNDAYLDVSGVGP